jgi:uncharacterized membrane protein YphA (DoxX/SURF4 family)
MAMVRPQGALIEDISMMGHQAKETHEEIKGRTWLKGLLLAARLCLGGIFVYASIDKIFHPADFAVAVYNYQILPDGLVNLAAIFLPWLELLLGICLIAGVWLPGATMIANALLIAFTGALLFNLARGLDIDCGCFSTSSAAGVSNAWYILRDILFLAIGGIVFYSTFIFKNRHPEMQPKKRAPNLMEEVL